MASILKPVDINKIWSATGDIIPPPDTKISQGWVVEIPPRQYFNYIDNKQDQAIAHINQFGICVWDSITEYQAGKSYVQGSDGVIYRAVSTNTNQNPVANNGVWSRVVSGGLLNIRNFTTIGTTIYTPTPGTRSIVVEVQGGGGGGGSAIATTASQASAGGGGSAGGYGKSYLTTGFSGVNIVIGAGGGANSPGGSTSFGDAISASGGFSPGAAIAYSDYPVQVLSVVGGGCTGGNLLNIVGEQGGQILLTRVGNGIAGRGGSSRFATGASAVAGNSTGLNAAFGAGGSGGISQGGGAQPGGSGGGGFVQVWEFA